MLARSGGAPSHDLAAVTLIESQTMRTSSFLPIARFELRTLSRQKSTWIFAAVLFAISMLLMASAAGLIPGATVGSSRGKVFVNAPSIIAVLVGVIGNLGLLITAAVMGKAVQRDFELRTASLFGTTPISRGAYLGGRFVGSLIVLIGIFSCIPLGLWAATLLPGLDTTRLGPNALASYVRPLFFLIVPNLVLTGGIFFALGARLRRFGPVMTAGVLMLVGYLVAQQLVRNLEHRLLAAMIEPFGGRALGELTRYWTAAESNVLQVPFSGPLLWNRLLWVAVAAVLSLALLWRFSFGTLALRTGRGKKAIAAQGSPHAASPRSSARPPAIRPERWNVRTALFRLVPEIAGRSFGSVVGTMGFRLTALAGVLILLAISRSVGSMYGTETFPVTYLVIEQMGGIFTLFLLIIITVYAAELIWQERESGMGDVFDALPTPGWAIHAGKYLGLVGVLVLLLAILATTGMLVQLALGHTQLEPGLWAFNLLVLTLPDLAMLAAMAFVVHLTVNHKHLGHVVMVVFYAASIFRGQLGLDHNLLFFGADPGVTYSDMNGFGHFLAPIAWFRAYWASWMLLLVIACALLVVRGRESAWTRRMATARTRFGGATRWSLLATAVMIAALGGWIFFNTNVVNTYETRFTGEAKQATYERTYKHLERALQPKVTASEVHVELYPEQREVTFEGTLTLVNRGSSPIDMLYLNLPSGSDPAEVRLLELGVPYTIETKDTRLGVWTVALSTPLSPGATTTLRYALHYAPRGLENQTGWTRLVENGSFLHSGYLPSIGYRADRELTVERVRKEHGLQPHSGMREPTEDGVRDTNYLTQHADWIDFRATIGTSRDQIALAPGYLQREWEQNGRRYFEYAMDAPILDFYSFVSARWEVRRDTWNDVAIEVYFHPGHDKNVDRMIEATKRSLAYFTKHFGPYQHRQVRILEFPRYESFAQSYPNTIPYSEALGFIAKVDPEDPEDVDYPTYVTAHEVAHQWWAHQVIGANARGTTFLSESLSQYAALMVMKEQYGDHRMRKFLKYELDQYLFGRSQEHIEERPLSRVENQPYIHYQKGSLAMYALQDYLGEEVVNAALRRFRDAWAFKGPPYPTSDDLISELRAAAPEELRYVVRDLLEDIVLYDNKAVSAKAKALGDDRYEVTLELAVKKARASGQGAETAMALDDLLEIGVLDANGEPLYLEKHRLKDERTKLTVTVQGKPVKAGVDPFIKLVDRDANDNTVAVEL